MPLAVYDLSLTLFSYAVDLLSLFVYMRHNSRVTSSEFLTGVLSVDLRDILGRHQFPRVHKVGSLLLIIVFNTYNY